MATLNPEQRRQYEARNRRLLAAVRAGVPYPLLAEQFGVNRHRAIGDARLPYLRDHMMPTSSVIYGE